MSEQLTVEQQLAVLRDQTRRFGTLHESQVFQLKMWGGVAFHGTGKWTLHLNVPDKSITYVLPKSGKRLPPNLPSLIAALQRSVTWLLGEEWGMSVKQSSKLLYDGRQVTTSTQNAKRNKRNKGAGT